MAKIIERGKLKVGKCKYCGCIFSYESEEVEMEEIKVGDIGKTELRIECPQCGLDTSVYER